MEIKVQNNRVTIYGNIKSIDDFQKIKASVDAIILHNKEIYLEIVDSLSITSSTIGYLNRVVQEDAITLHLLAKSEQLLLLLEDLGLSQTFRTRRLP
jgi:hypothetical protein